MNIEDAVVDALAVHRLARLATTDVITRPLRARIIRFAYHGEYPYSGGATEAGWDELPTHQDDAPKLADFVVCRWCTGIWIAGLVVAARRYAPSVWSPLARVLALADVGALLAGLEQ